MLSNGATVMISGGSVKTTGAGSFGFLVQPFTPTVSLIAEPGLPALPFAAEPTSPNVLQISNATVTSAADAFHVQGAIADIAVSGSSITSGNGVLLNTVSSGATTLTATGSQLTGAITTNATSTANVTLQGDSTWTMTGSSNSDEPRQRPEHYRLHAAGRRSNTADQLQNANCHELHWHGWRYHT